MSLKKGQWILGLAILFYPSSLAAQGKIDTSYYPNGSIASIMTYCGDFLCGDAVQYNYEGKLLYKGSYRLDSSGNKPKPVEHGAIERYYYLGTIKEEYTSQMGFDVGWRKRYAPTGKLVSLKIDLAPPETNLRGRKLTLSYYPNGALRAVEGLQLEQSVHWYSTGQIQEIREEYRTKDEKVWTIGFNQDGDIIRATYRMGTNIENQASIAEKDSLRNIYEEPSTYSKEDITKHTGEWTVTIAGKPYLQLQCLEGKLHGEQRMYSAKGDLLIEQAFRKGRLIKKPNNECLEKVKIHTHDLVLPDFDSVVCSKYNTIYCFKKTMAEFKTVLTITLYENGTRKLIEYDNKESNAWFESGELMMNRTLDTEDTTRLKTITFHSNGAVKSQYYTPANNLYARLGTLTEWYENGDLKLISNYHKNQLHGNYEYHPTDSIYWIGQYRKGKQEGTWSQYDQDDQLIKTVQYHNGFEVFTPLGLECECIDTGMTLYGFTSARTFLDSQKFISREFDFHSSAVGYLDGVFIGSLRTDGNSGGSFDLISKKLIKVGLPDENGLHFVLNYCTNGREMNVTPSGVTYSNMSNYNIYFEPLKSAIEVDTLLLHQWNVTEKEAYSFENRKIPTAYVFAPGYVRYGPNGIDFDNHKNGCFPTSMITGTQTIIQKTSGDQSDLSTITQPESGRSYFAPFDTLYHWMGTRPYGYIQKDSRLYFLPNRKTIDKMITVEAKWTLINYQNLKTNLWCEASASDSSLLLLPIANDALEETGKKYKISREDWLKELRARGLKILGWSYLPSKNGYSIRILKSKS